jgi:hypothetical protein
VRLNISYPKTFQLVSKEAVCTAFENMPKGKYSMFHARNQYVWSIIVGYVMLVLKM